MLCRNVILKGMFNGFKDRFEEMVGFYERYGIKFVIDKVVGFEEVKEVFKYLYVGLYFGKVVIKIV